jgi:hypothetical protein
LKKTLVWDIDRFTNLTLTCSDEFFFEALASNIKGSVISFQTFTKKLANLKQSRLVQQINALKENYIGNQDEIATLEQELNSIVNSEVLLKVRSMKLFSCLNSEKPTPIFLSLARAGNSSSRLDNILDDQGTPFVSDEIRTENIVSYYENIYKKQDSDMVSYTNCIEHFLGEELVNHPIVKNSKLTESEKLILDAPLTVAELDQSIDKCNVRSAPGIDGYSNMFIKHFWRYFRIHLHKYALCCYDKGLLTTNFRSASIKLIPKKGNNTQLKNWRPISLLSNMYKIISRAINNRLNLVVNCICS